MEHLPLVGGVFAEVGALLDGIVEWALGLGLWAVFVLAFGDSFGLPSSGELAMLLWAGAREHPLALVIAVGFLGAALGDNGIYWLARLLGDPVIRRVVKPETQAKAQGYVTRHGAKAIIGGRMLAAIRTKVAILAGAARYPYARFLLYDAIGCLIWAVAYGAIGRLVGDAVGVTSVVDQVGIVAVIGAVIVIALAAVQHIVLPRLAARRLDGR